ncbi:ATP-dependent DNA ligase [Streptomyces sp. NPDC048001]|uniref:ATP-dependent DNA ligase n=1 Tax=unclassified Streptomyces TaxID=2593676 RepID=UPI00371688CF
MLLARVAAASREVAGTSARSGKTALLADLFGQARPEDVALVIAYLSGRPPQGRIGIGWRLLGEEVPAATEPTLTLTETDAALTAIAGTTGPGSRTARRDAVHALLGAATAEEQRFLVRLLTGEVRQGALHAVALEAVARAAGVPAADLRRAVMLDGSLPRVARAVLADGAPALTLFRLQVGRPVQPMLAHSAGTVAEALAALGTACAVEEKLDGIRVQVHRRGGEVRVYTRSLEDITDRLPDVAEAAGRLAGDGFVLDGEVIALTPGGRPAPFQDIASRVGSRSDVAAARAALPLSPVYFDLLAAEGAGLLDLPARERHARLAALVPEDLRVRRLTVVDPASAEEADAARRFFDRALRDGREGVVVKSLDAPYSAGRRGRSWLKVKPVRTLDLVVVAVERGHGRRTGLLSNLHLAARGTDGRMVMLGKTFKGLTDAMLAWQTEHLGRLAVRDDGRTVTVRPELVVEIAYDGLQRSPRYPAGVALRFARVVRHRPDKSAAEADTIEHVLATGGAPDAPAAPGR